MRQRIVTIICIAVTFMCLTSCGGNQDADVSSIETSTDSSVVQSLEAHESGMIELPENAEGQLR